ncbi:MAG TPA: DUF4231 domain-containing protein [Anaerolineae bacterium]|nr:DUF4231 domain-containing protein [Anaerolineae bacterium]
MNETDYLDNRLNNQIKWYSDKSSENKKYYYTLKILQIISAACVPFLVSQISTEDNQLKILVEIIGIIVVITSGIMTAFRFNELWTNYRTTAETLKHEKYLFLSNAEPDQNEGNFPILVKRVESLISKEHSIWDESSRKDEEKK